jgi:DNA-binding PadR family transcriptional regulator
MSHRASEKSQGKGFGEIDALLASFCKVRILNYASKEPIHASSILDRLHHHGCTIAVGTLNGMVFRMVRNGWLKTKNNSGHGGLAGPHYTLTKQGQRVLDLTRKHLGSLMEKLKPHRV